MYIYFRVENTISWNCNGRNHLQIQGKTTEQTLHPLKRMASFHRNLNKQKRTPTKLTKRIYQRNIKKRGTFGLTTAFQFDDDSVDKVVKLGKCTKCALFQR